MYSALGCLILTNILPIMEDEYDQAVVHLQCGELAISTKMPFI